MAVTQTEIIQQTLISIAMSDDSDSPQAKTDLEVISGAMAHDFGLRCSHSPWVMPSILCLQHTKPDPGAEEARIHTVENVVSVIDDLL